MGTQQRSQDLCTQVNFFHNEDIFHDTEMQMKLIYEFFTITNLIYESVGVLCVCATKKLSSILLCCLKVFIVHALP